MLQNELQVQLPLPSLLNDNLIHAVPQSYLNPDDPNPIIVALFQDFFAASLEKRKQLLDYLLNNVRQRLVRITIEHLKTTIIFGKLVKDFEPTTEVECTLKLDTTAFLNLPNITTVSIETIRQVLAKVKIQFVVTVNSQVILKKEDDIFYYDPQYTYPEQTK